MVVNTLKISFCADHSWRKKPRKNSGEEGVGKVGGGSFKNRHYSKKTEINGSGVFKYISSQNGPFSLKALCYENVKLRQLYFSCCVGTTDKWQICSKQSVK